MAANMDNSKPPQGVYMNPRLMHACTTIVGFTVHLQTKDGKVWEGLFSTFSPDFTICLDLAIQIDPKLNSKDCLYAALKSGLQAERQAFFDLKDIVRISVVDVDLNYATKDSAKLTTDADISGYDANKSGGEHKQLESWQDEDGDNVNEDSLLSLDDPLSSSGNKNDSQKIKTGWDPQEMFEYNQRVHKVTTTYDEKLTGYTVQLPKHMTKEWRKRAETIAKEIEGNRKSQVRLAKEDEGDCEEEKFSAVLRPLPSSNRPTSSHKAHNNDATNDVPEEGKQAGAAGNSLPETQQHQQSLQQHQQHRPSPNNSSVQAQGPPIQNIRSLARDDKCDDDSNKYNLMHRPNRINTHAGNQNGTHKNFRPRFQDRGTRLDSLKNFSKQLTLAPSPRQPQNHNLNQMHNASSNQNPMTQAHHQEQPQQQAQHKPVQQPTQHSQPQQPPQLQHPHQSHPQQQHPHQSHPQQQHPHQSHPQQQHPHQQQQQQQQPQQQQQHQHQPQQPQQQQPQPPDQSQQNSASKQTQQQPQQQQPQQNQPAQVQVNVTGSSPATVSTTPTTSTVNTSTVSERSDSSSAGSLTKDRQTELARKSTLNPDAKEFVYKPRSPATNHGVQTNGIAQPSTSGAATLDPANSSPMNQAPHASYYQPVPMFPLGLSPHQQQHHAAQFMPNHTHPHFQNQIHYMSPVPPHFAQQMSQRYIRGNFQNYHHRGGEYSQASMMAPTSTGQPFVPQPSGAPHPMNAYAASQQPMIYNGPPQSMYPVVQAGFPQHVPHVMPNPTPYDGTVWSTPR